MNAKTLAAIAAMLATTSISAAEIKVLASNGVKEALNELAPAFERATKHKVAISYGLAAGLNDLAKQGKVDPRGRAAIARSGVGIGIRKGARRPDIRTEQALRRTLLAADSITWAKEGQSGIYFADLLKRIGIAERMKPKIVPASSGVEVGKLVASGKVQLGVILVNELMAAPGVELLGPLPPELQNYTVFHAGVGVGSKDPSAAKALIKFLTTPAAGAVFKAKGQEPG